MPQNDPIGTREKIKIIVSNIESKEKDFLDKKSGRKYILDNLRLVQDYLDSISGKEVFNELDVFFDFQLVESVQIFLYIFYDYYLLKHYQLILFHNFHILFGHRFHN